MTEGRTTGMEQPAVSQPWAVAAHGQAATMHQLSVAGVPKALLRIVFLLIQHSGFEPLLSQGLHCVEFFAGKQRVCKSVRSKGFRAVPYDKLTVDPVLDICSAQGFAIAVALVLACHQEALVWFAPVCSSWVFINRGTSMRSCICSTGNTELLHVKEGNLMASRVCLLVRLAEARGLSWVIEQPLSSLFHYHKRFQDLVACMAVFKTHVRLGAYGADSRKPLYLLSGRQWIAALHRPERRSRYAAQTYRSYIDSKGRKRVVGLKPLKATQTYPRAFGRAVARVFLQHAESQGGLVQPAVLKQVDGDRAMLRMEAGDDKWLDAELQPVEMLLRGGGEDGH